MKARLDRETVEKITVTILVVDVNAQFPPQQNATGGCCNCVIRDPIVEGCGTRALDSQSRKPGYKPSAAMCLGKFIHSFVLRCPSSPSWRNEYLVADSGA